MRFARRAAAVLDEGCGVMLLFRFAVSQSISYSMALHVQWPCPHCVLRMVQQRPGAWSDRQHSRPWPPRVINMQKPITLNAALSNNSVDAPGA